MLVGGSTIYPSSGVDDQRPRFAFDAAELVHRGGVPEVLELRRGDEVVIASAAHAGGGVPPRAKIQVFAWAA